MTGMLVLMGGVGLAAGVLNFAAAGGSLLPFVVMSVVLGIPPLAANATVLAATPFSFLRAAGDVKDTPRVMRLPLACAVGGTAVGVWIVSHVLTEGTFRRAVPVLLIISVTFLLCFRHVKKWIDARHGRTHLPSHATLPTLAIGITITSMYAGAFGGGVAVMILGLLTVATSWPWDRVNTAKNVVCLFTSVVGFFAYVPTGLVIWPLCIVLAVTMVLGSFLGKWVTKVVPAKTLRLVVAVLTTLSAGYLWASS